jgi:hypothetical protein
VAAALQFRRACALSRENSSFQPQFPDPKLHPNRSDDAK